MEGYGIGDDMSKLLKCVLFRGEHCVGMAWEVGLDASPRAVAVWMMPMSAGVWGDGQTEDRVSLVVLGNEFPRPSFLLESNLRCMMATHAGV
jgi:hypothetical protein